MLPERSPDDCCSSLRKVADWDKDHRSWNRSNRSQRQCGSARPPHVCKRTCGHLSRWTTQAATEQACASLPLNTKTAQNHHDDLGVHNNDYTSEIRPVLPWQSDSPSRCASRMLHRSAHPAFHLGSARTCKLHDDADHRMQLRIHRTYRDPHKGERAGALDRDRSNTNGTTPPRLSPLQHSGALQQSAHHPHKRTSYLACCHVQSYGLLDGRWACDKHTCTWDNGPRNNAPHHP
mmetsp:Transcript_2755/g.6516  ORF Transcript_2755/g.6516 Transcript_2755/m.6516 type:complete len:234 (+) Transcript_2755:690-1391(+)